MRLVDPSWAQYEIGAAAAECRGPCDAIPRRTLPAWLSFLAMVAEVACEWILPGLAVADLSMQNSANEKQEICTRLN